METGLEKCWRWCGPVISIQMCHSKWGWEESGGILWGRGEQLERGAAATNREGEGAGGMREKKNPLLPYIFITCGRLSGRPKV